MTQESDNENVSFNPKVVVGILTIISIFVSLVLWVGSVNASTEQNTKDIDRHDTELELMKAQFNAMNIKLNVIEEQNKQMKTTLNEVRTDVQIIKESR